MSENNDNLDKASLILQAICYAIAHADQECGKVQASSNWLTLFDAAARQAHYLISGSNLDEIEEMLAAAEDPAKEPCKAFSCLFDSDREHKTG